MDTTWYAVDEDGFVGEFQTGEDGAFPLHATVGPEAGDFDGWALDALLIGRALVDGTLPRPSKPPSLPTRPVAAVLVLAPESEGRDDALEALLGRDVVTLHEGPPRIVATRGPLPPKRFKALAAAPQVERIVLSDEVENEESETVYRYGADDWGNPGSYGRDHAPDAPLSVTDAPTEFRQALAKLKLPLRFAETPKLHLADLLVDEDCSTWADCTLRGEPREAAPRSHAPGSHALRNYIIALIILAVCALLLWLR